MEVRGSLIVHDALVELETLAVGAIVAHLDTVLALLRLVHQIQAVQLGFSKRLVQVYVDVVAHIAGVEGDGVGVEEGFRALVDVQVIE